MVMEADEHRVGRVWKVGGKTAIGREWECIVRYDACMKGVGPSLD